MSEIIARDVAEQLDIQNVIDAGGSFTGIRPLSQQSSERAALMHRLHAALIGGVALVAHAFAHLHAYVLYCTQM